MSTETFKLSGSYTTQPLSGSPSGVPSCEAPIAETVVLGRSLPTSYSLTADAPVPVDLGGITNVHVLVVKTTGGKVRVRITSSDGATQAIPVDSFLSLTTLSVPITARLPSLLSLARPTARTCGHTWTMRLFMSMIIGMRRP